VPFDDQGVPRRWTNATPRPRLPPCYVPIRFWRFVAAALRQAGTTISATRAEGGGTALNRIEAETPLAAHGVTLTSRDLETLMTPTLVWLDRVRSLGLEFLDVRLIYSRRRP
jgi:hypothetical protein